MYDAPNTFVRLHWEEMVKNLLHSQQLASLDSKKDTSVNYQVPVYQNPSWTSYSDHQFDIPTAHSSDELRDQLRTINNIGVRTRAQRAYLGNKAIVRYMMSVMNDRGKANEVADTIMDQGEYNYNKKHNWGARGNYMEHDIYSARYMYGWFDDFPAVNRDKMPVKNNTPWSNLGEGMFPDVITYNLSGANSVKLVAWNTNLKILDMKREPIWRHRVTETDAEKRTRILAKKELRVHPVHDDTGYKPSPPIGTTTGKTLADLKRAKHLDYYLKHHLREDSETEAEKRARLKLEKEKRHHPILHDRSENTFLNEGGTQQSVLDQIPVTKTDLLNQPPDAKKGDPVHTKDNFDRADPYFSVHTEEYRWSEQYKQWMHSDEWKSTVVDETPDTDEETDEETDEPDTAVVPPVVVPPVVVPLVPPVVVPPVVPDVNVITDDDPDVNVITDTTIVVPPKVQGTDQFDHNVHHVYKDPIQIPHVPDVERLGEFTRTGGIRPLVWDEALFAQFENRAMPQPKPDTVAPPAQPILA